MDAVVPATHPVTRPSTTVMVTASMVSATVRTSSRTTSGRSAAATWMRGRCSLCRVCSVTTTNAVAPGTSRVRAQASWTDGCSSHACRTRPVTGRSSRPAIASTTRSASNPASPSPSSPLLMRAAATGGRSTRRSISVVGLRTTAVAASGPTEWMVWATSPGRSQTPSVGTCREPSRSGPGRRRACPIRSTAVIPASATTVAHSPSSLMCPPTRPSQRRPHRALPSLRPNCFRSAARC